MKTNDILLSIIIPFYNVEKYIAQCITSLFDQDISRDQYEVILINDCSSDSSLSIVLKLLKEYPEIILINHTENKKQGGARNTGLKIAKGDYVWFIDSDDFLMPNVLHHLLDIALLNNLDVLHFDYLRIYENGEKELYPTIYNSGIGDGNSFFFYSAEIWWKKNVEVWRRLHKRSFLVQNNLIFEENRHFEDVSFSIRVFNYAKRVMHISFLPICYRYNTSSFFKSPVTGKKLFEIFISSKLVFNMLKEDSLDKRYFPIIEEFARFHFNDVGEMLWNLSAYERSSFFSYLRKPAPWKKETKINLQEYLSLKYPVLNKIFNMLKLYVHKTVTYE